MRESIKKISILYLGNRGGGASNTESFCRELSQHDFFFTMMLNKRNEILNNFKKFKSGDIMELDIPETKVRLINPYFFLKCLIRVITKSKKNETNLILIPMHHPYSVLMVPFLRLASLKVISGIHDFIPHEGDKKFLVKFANLIIIIFSSKILFFSKNQLKKATLSYPHFMNKFMKVRLSNDFQRTKDFRKPHNPDFDFIFFGRLEPYKGIARLKEAWKSVILLDPHATLLIRGNGPDSEELSSLKSMPGVDCKVGYVDPDKVESLMRDVKVLLAPHDSATQSGLTGIASTFGMLAVTTPCEGFIEQSDYNSRILIAKDFTPKSFALSMMESKKLWNWTLHNEDQVFTTGFLDLLPEIL